MRGKDVFSAFLIIIIFMVLLFSNILSVGVSTIKKNWPIYRCNPLIMPFAGMFGHDPATNMTYCIQSMQSEYMQYLLEPVHYAISVTGNIGSQLMGDIQSVRNVVSNTSSFSGSNFLDVYTKLTNIRVEFQRILYKFQDVLKKVLGIITTFLYLITGGMDTGRSVINGPIGKTFDTVCFHPHTLVPLQSGKHQYIKDIQLGDVLQDGTIVEATMKIRPNSRETMYRLWCDSINDYIMITGSHYYQSKNDKSKDDKSNDNPQWNQICNHPNAIPYNEFNFESIEYLSCLVTNTGRIPIGEHILSDWEYDGTTERFA